MALTRAEFDQYLREARRRFNAGRGASVAEIRAVYKRAAEQVARDILRMLPQIPGPEGAGLSARQLGPIMEALDRARASLNQQVLNATYNGIGLSVAAPISAAERVAIGMLGPVFMAGGIRAVYHSINTRAVLALTTRTRFDGLRLSDRVWREGSRWQSGVTRALETAVARGQAARSVALEVQTLLKPGPVQPNSLEVRRRLGIGKSVDWRAMRLARTEMGIAYKEASVLGNQGAPSYLGSKWELSASHAFQDICDELASGGPNGGGIYPAGDEPMQPHPHCFCVLSPIHEDPDKFADRLSDWLDDPSADPGLEDWYQNVASPIFSARPSVVRPSREPVRAGARARVTPGSTVPNPIASKLPVDPARYDQPEARTLSDQLDEVEAEARQGLMRAVARTQEQEARRAAAEVERTVKEALTKLDLPDHDLWRNQL